MVIRLWTYRVGQAKISDFEHFEEHTGVPMVGGQPGCLGVEFFQRFLLSNETNQAGEDQVEYVMISRWENAAKLEQALASQEWHDEIALFQTQHFSDQPGTLAHFEVL